MGQEAEHDERKKIFEGNADVIIDEAENRLHTQKAIMMLTMGNFGRCRRRVGMLTYVGRRTPRVGASAAPTKNRRVRRTNLGGGDR